ncbi:hypothetical protein CP965_03745 [Halarcobacter mediterraneus]|uniref:Plasmid recombination enzyme n=2 Tax=Halarcobacter mediterraneus TaxID=2023153 RepID=A0A4Q1AZW9_9BACT|nr:hypothetical protein CP965_03745 [Halarcobacter mediterraneus]
MKMADYVQVRFETCSSSLRQINHDFRLSKVSYLRDNMFHNKYKNSYMKYDSNIVKQKVKKSYNEYNKIFRENHKKKHGNYRNLTKGKQSDFLSGIITLSPSINDKLENKVLTKTQLEKYFRQAIKNIQLEIKKAVGEDIELFYSVIHYDEKTPHMHFDLQIIQVKDKVFL